MSLPATTTFDPLSQNVTFFTAGGINTTTTTFADLDTWFFMNVRLCINYGSQMGACLVMLFVTMLLTKHDKRWMPIWNLNMLSLMTAFIRALLLSLYSVSPWSELWGVAADDVSMVPKSAYYIQIAGGPVMGLLLTIFVDLSLVLQVHAIIKVMSRERYISIMAASVFVYLMAVGFRFAQTVTNSEAIMSASLYLSKEWLQNGVAATETIAIGFFSIVFLWKLVYTKRERTRMGLTQWSYLDCLATGATCTMIVPAIFSTFEFVDLTNFPGAGTLIMTMVALLLPLSSLWAGMDGLGSNVSFNIRALWGSRKDTKSLLSSQNTRTGSDAHSTGRNGSLPFTGGFSSTTNRTAVRASPQRSPRSSPDQDLEMGVRVDKSYTVRTNNIADY